METTKRLTMGQLRAFREGGYLLIRDLFRREEVRELLDEFMAMHAGGPIPGHFEPESEGDVLKLYPRVMHPHRINETALRYLLDDRLRDVVMDLFAEEPLAAQCMMYFKLAGGKGEALHQDNFFLKDEPGTCIAAWIALDAATAENGCLEVVPGTHDMDAMLFHSAC